MGQAVKVSISSNIAETLNWTQKLSSQFPFVVAKTLTDLAKAVQADVPKELEKSLDRPTPFTTRGTFVTPARKTRLESVVGFKDKQAAYLVYQVQGGTRTPTHKALRLPSVVELNQYGNLPAGLIKKLVARANAGKRATKGQARKYGIRADLNLFYGDPKDGRPPGIYQRVPTDPPRLVPIVVFPARPAKYRKRYDFYANAQQIVQRNANETLARNWELAVATAR